MEEDRDGSVLGRIEGLRDRVGRPLETDILAQHLTIPGAKTGLQEPHLGIARDVAVRPVTGGILDGEAVERSHLIEIALRMLTQALRIERCRLVRAPVFVITEGVSGEA